MVIAPALRPLIRQSTARLYSTTKMAALQPHVLIVGGAYAGLSALNTLISFSANPPPPPSGQEPLHGPPTELPAIARALRQKPRYTLLDERDGFYHSVGAPLGQISLPFAREFWIGYDEILRQRTADGGDVSFVQGTATALDMQAKVLSYATQDAKREVSVVQQISYDYLVLATGMKRGAPALPQALHRDQYLADVEAYENELSQYSKILLVGGGAVGIEFAAEMKVHFPNSEVTLVHSRDKLLSSEPLTDEYKAVALKLLKEGGVNVILGQRVVSETDTGSSKEVQLSNGDKMSCDKVIYTAVQQGANTGFIPKEVLDDQGCIKARDTLQFPTTLPNADYHFAVGDIVAWTNIKRSGPAQNMGKLAAANIVVSLLAAEEGANPVLGHLPVSKPTMTLAIGEQAIGMRAGMRWGREVKQRAFGRGLGIDGTLRNLKITPPPTSESLASNGTQVEQKAFGANI